MQLNLKTVDKLVNLKGYNRIELDFFKECFNIIIKCRHILKWSHVEAFYASKNMDLKSENLFIIQQESLEKHCEDCHVFVEKDLTKYLDIDRVDGDDVKEFFQYKEQVLKKMEVL